MHTHWITRPRRPHLPFHQYPACNMRWADGFNVTRGACNNAPKTTFDYMGYSVRTPQWRYTLWVRWDNVTLTPIWDGPSAEELYGHVGDNSSSFDEWENVNQARTNTAAAGQMRAQLESFFRRH